MTSDYSGSYYSPSPSMNFDYGNTNFDTSTSFDTYRPIDIIDNYSASSYFDNYLSNNDWNSFANITDPSIYRDVTADNIFEVATGIPDFGEIAEDFGFDTTDFYEDGSGAGDLNIELIGDPFINAVFDDASTISQTELNLLDTTGVVSYDNDGQLVVEGTDKAVDSVNDVIAAIDTKIEEGNLSTGDESALGQLKTELNHSIDLGVNEVTFENPNMPIGTERTFDNAGYDQYTDPYYSPYGSTVSPGLNTPMLGNAIFNPRGDTSYVGDYGDGRVGPTMQDVYGRPVDSLGQLTYGEAFGGMSPNAIAQAAARRDYADAMGTPNMFDRSGLLVENRMGFNDYFDNFTDFLSNGVTTILSPLDALAGGIGQGFAKVGGIVGDNPIGRGISNFGRVIDGTGNFLFNQVPNTIINYPDNIANIGSGLFRTLTGANMGIGQPTNTGLLISGVKGLFTDPLKLGLNALSIPLSVATDVFGIDKLSMNAGGSGGGGGKKRKKPQAKARKNVPLVMNKDGSLRRVGSNEDKGSGTMAIGKPVNGNLDSDGSSGSGGVDTGTGLNSGSGSTVNVNGFGGSDSNAESGKLASTDADKSDVKEAVSETQGDPGSTATQPQQSTRPMGDLLDQAAGETAIVLDPEQLQALNSYEDMPEAMIRVPVDFQGGNTFRSGRTLTA